MSPFSFNACHVLLSTQAYRSAQAIDSQEVAVQTIG